MPGTPGRSGNFQMGQDATVPDGPPDLPVGISTAARAKWFELMDQIPQDILRQVDQHQLRMLAELLALADRYQAQVAGDPMDHKTARLLLQIAQQVSRLSAAYGLAPSDRKRLNIKAPTEPDEFQEWLARATGCP